MVPRAPATNGGRNGSLERTARRDYVGAIVGLGVTVAGLAVLYPAVVALAAPMRYLAVTALVGGFVVVWLAVWTCIEAAWTWRGGGPNRP